MPAHTCRRPAAAASLCAAALLLAACATPSRGPGGATPSATPGDPLEPLNRASYSTSRGLDRALVRPVATAYRRMIPRPIRRAASNVIRNLDEPVVAANDVLQGRLPQGVRSLIRFGLNSTLGVAGLFDPAAGAGLPHHDNGFANTLGRWGAAPGPYVYLPVLGPTSLRDLIGSAGDYALDPLTWAKFHGAQTLSTARTGVSLLSQRVDAEQDLKRLDRTSADPYASLRSIYVQSRAAEVGGDAGALEPLPELPPGEEQAPKAPGPQPASPDPTTAAPPLAPAPKAPGPTTP